MSVRASSESKCTCTNPAPSRLAQLHAVIFRNLRGNDLDECGGRPELSATPGLVERHPGACRSAPVLPSPFSDWWHAPHRSMLRTC